MKNYKLISGMLVILLTLTGCDIEYKIAREETLVVEGLNFTKVNPPINNVKVVEIDTEEETVLIELENLKMYKYDEDESTIKIKWLESDALKNPRIEGKLYVGKNDIQEISKNYSNEYRESMYLEKPNSKQTK